MDNRHQAYRRDLPDSRQAILFIHGICGSPVFFEDFYQKVPSSWSLSSLLLEGHGGGTRDFTSSSMAAWKAQVAEEVDRLADQHDALMIVGHSMGTLLAIEQSLRRPETIKSLFLLALPLAVRPRPAAVTHSVRTALGLNRSQKPALQAARRVYGIQPDRKIWRYLGFIPRYWELMKEMRASRERLLEVRVPVHVFQSKKDEVVSPRTTAYLMKNPRMDLAVLEKSDHKYHPPADKAFLLEAFESACQAFDASHQ
ncbi:MAG TPA: alpha/beta fold hydrolase [Clostridia bacterium]|jgi:esterase/lipase|nr:alpha/beta fold hydrolase [Clostridia bacterium]